MDEDIEALAEANGGYWGEHPDHPESEWLIEVAALATRRGYWEWVEARIEEARSDHPVIERSTP